MQKNDWSRADRARLAKHCETLKASGPGALDELANRLGISLTTLWRWRSTDSTVAPSIAAARTVREVIRG